jgi:DNA-binding XRE family transcriptional regulator
MRQVGVQHAPATRTLGLDFHGHAPVIHAQDRTRLLSRGDQIARRAGWSAVDLAALSRNVKAARDAAGLTQDQAADAADMQSAVYSRIERGEVDPRLSSLVKIAKALGVDLADLLRGVG